MEFIEENHGYPNSAQPGAKFPRELSAAKFLSRQLKVA
jgi:hypothetical protein